MFRRRFRFEGGWWAGTQPDGLQPELINLGIIDVFFVLHVQ
jgi:hypothetical protein